MGGDYLGFIASWHTIGIIFVILLLMIVQPFIGSPAGRFVISLVALLVLILVIATTPTSTWLEWLSWVSIHWWVYIVAVAVLALCTVVAARFKK